MNDLSQPAQGSAHTPENSRGNESSHGGMQLYADDDLTLGWGRHYSSPPEVTAPEATGKSRLKIVLMSVAAVVVLAGGGIGGYLWLDARHSQAQAEAVSADTKFQQAEALLVEADDLLARAGDGLAIARTQDANAQLIENVENAAGALQSARDELAQTLEFHLLDSRLDLPGEVAEQMSILDTALNALLDDLDIVDIDDARSAYDAALVDLETAIEQAQQVYNETALEVVDEAVRNDLQVQWYGAVKLVTLYADIDREDMGVLNTARKEIITMTGNLIEATEDVTLAHSEWQLLQETRTAATEVTGEVDTPGSDTGVTPRPSSPSSPSRPGAPSEPSTPGPSSGSGAGDENGTGGVTGDVTGDNGQGSGGEDTGDETGSGGGNDPDPGGGTDPGADDGSGEDSGEDSEQTSPGTETTP